MVVDLEQYKNLRKTIKFHKILNIQIILCYRACNDMKQPTSLKLTVIILIMFHLLTLNLLLGNHCMAKHENILHVDDDGEAEYSSIQEALKHAQHGDTVFVHNGTYFENLTVNKPITLLGEDKKTTTIVNNETTQVVHVISDFVNIKGFTITSNVQSTQHIIGVKIASNNTRVTDCIIMNNSGDGIVITSLSSNNVIQGNIIINNMECGVSAAYINHTKIEGNQIINNRVGVSLCSSFYNRITENAIVNYTEHGVKMCGSSNHNLIYLNDIANRQIQAFDLHENIWYNQTLQRGNYWGDYNGIDANGDGVGDTPYNIYGGGNQDIYPLTKPVVSKNFSWTKHEDREVQPISNNSLKKVCILVFYNPVCDSCLKTLGYINSLNKRYNLGIVAYNVLTQEGLELQQRYFTAFKVPKEKRGMFSLFIGNKCFTSEEEVFSDLEHEIHGYMSTGCDCPEAGGNNDAAVVFSTLDASHIAASGLMNGVNPCVFATFVFFIAYLGFSKINRKITMATGFLFAAAVFLTYLLIELGFFQPFYLIPGVPLVSHLIYVSAALFALLAAFLNLLGYIDMRKQRSVIYKPRWFFRRKEGCFVGFSTSGKILVVLPILSFLTGFLLSLLRFSCTNQVHLLTIMYVAMAVPVLKNQAVLYLLLYNTVFILPLLVLTV
ncbi:MAG TPA: hypothetical protein ENI42_03975, partial [Thermoplasmatales archaeon]|nr:hypothetical protein [Thermoplasmatales archaeon]